MKIEPYKPIFQSMKNGRLVAYSLDIDCDLIINPFIGKSNLPIVTPEEFQDIINLSECNLHIPYILSLLNERSNSL